MSKTSISSHIQINVSGTLEVVYDKLSQKLILSFDQTHPDIVGKIDTQLIINKRAALSLARALKRINIE